MLFNSCSIFQKKDDHINQYPNLKSYFQKVANTMFTYPTSRHNVVRHNASHYIEVIRASALKSLILQVNTRQDWLFSPEVYF